MNILEELMEVIIMYICISKESGIVLMILKFLKIINIKAKIP